MIITVKSLREVKEGWYELTDENDKKHNLFANKIPDLDASLLYEGAILELKKEKQGVYAAKDGTMKDNWITVAVKPSTVKEAVEKDKSSEYATFHMRQDSIEKQNALTNAVNFWAGRFTGVDFNADERTVLHTAETWYNWVNKGIIPPDPFDGISSPAQKEKAAKK